jgi:hypothetical protein
MKFNPCTKLGVKMSLKYFTLAAMLATTSMSNAATTFLYSQPYVSSIAPVMANDPAGGTVPNTAMIRTYGVGATNQVPNWDVSSFSGLVIPGNLRGNFERTVDANWLGSTAIQAYENAFGLQLHTYSSPVFSDRHLKTINVDIDFSESVKPWGGQFGTNAKLCMGFLAAIPSSWSGEGSENYSGSNFSFRDSTSGKMFTIGVMLYSTLQPTEEVGFDGGAGSTDMPMVSSYFGASKYITTTPSSSYFRSQTWGDEEYFGFCLTRTNIESVVADVNQKYPGYNFSVNNLIIGSAAIGTEIAIGPMNINNGHMAARFRHWNILIED